MGSSGVYIVTLTNEHPISVNAHDPRRPSCIKVNRQHCKVGKATNLQAREKNYRKTFGETHVHFAVIAYTEDLALAEKAILERLRRWRIRGDRGRLHEWLERIEPAEARTVAIDALKVSGAAFILAEEMENAS